MSTNTALGIVVTLVLCSAILALHHEPIGEVWTIFFTVAAILLLLCWVMFFSTPNVWTKFAFPTISLTYLAFVLFFFFDLGHTDKPTHAIFFVGALTVVLGTLGWIANVYVSQHNARRQHTMNVLLAHSLSKSFRSSMDTINRSFPKQASISATVFSDGDEDTQSAIKYVLNYYEFIALGVDHGDLDEKIMEDAYSGIICGFYERAEPLVTALRGEDEKGDAKRPKVLHHLRSVYLRWKQRRAEGSE